MQGTIPMPAADGQFFAIGNSGSGAGSPFLVDVMARLDQPAFRRDEPPLGS